MIKDIVWLMLSTLQRTFRKKSSWVLFFGLPVAGILVSTLLYGGAGQPLLRVGIVNGDGSERLAADTVRMVGNLKDVKLVEMDAGELRNELASGNLDTGIVLERGYSEGLRSGKLGHVGIQSVKGATVTSYIKAMLNQYMDNISAISRIAGSDQPKFDKLYAGFQSANFKLAVNTVTDISGAKRMSYQSIGFLIMFMMTSAVNLSELILVNRENRTYFRILSSPISARTYVLSNIFVNLCVMFAQILVALFFLIYVFKLNVGMGIGPMLVILGLFSLTSVGISLVVVAFSKNSAGAGALQNFIVMPTCLLSGCFIPLEIMPNAVRRIADFLPQNWVLESFEKLQSGAALGSLWFNMMLLFAFGLMFFLIASYKFGRNNDTRNFV
ncbi:ABC transporter permease [Paenibacillus sp. J22TS3]|uniref:ABC transporter permease n=1 Tax=Paenibacillus sp. J22TS3 TaxID=2807192 RepID=UPI001B1DF055|nr:ABC transporter permease [Paenibacillus sp. J22TS3]GIP24544.1 ABC transporter permease [Paenibacillus sp. J22TS3]